MANTDRIVFPAILSNDALQDLIILLDEEEIEFAHDYLEDMKLFKASKRSALKPIAERMRSEKAKTYLNNPYIQEYMQYLVMAEGRRLEVTHSKVIDELAKIAFCDIREILEVPPGENLVRIRDMSKIPYPGVIKEFKSRVVGKDRQVIYEVKLYDKMKALEMLCGILGLSEDAQAAKAGALEGNKTTVVNKIIVNHRARNQVLEISK